MPRDENQKQLLRPKHKDTASCRSPLCATCIISKKSTISPSRKITQNTPTMVLKQHLLKPVDKVSIYQYIYSIPNRLPHTRGKEDATQRYVEGTIFVDHPSGYVFLNHQVGLTADKTL